MLLHPTILLSLACVMMLGLQGWMVWNVHEAQVSETEASLVNLASSLTQHAEDTIKIADAAVVGIVTLLQSNGTSPDVIRSLARTLPTQMNVGTDFQDIVVLGVNGDWIATSATIKPGNFSDRSYFRHHRDDPDQGPFVGPPVQSRLNGHWIITVSRRIQTADGNFAGVVLATIELSNFADYYATYQLGLKGTITLSATDGTLLARYPSVTSLTGQKFPNARIFRELRTHATGSYVNTAIIDGIRRFVGYRKSDRFPLVVAVAMAQDVALRAWRHDACIDMAIALALTLGAGLLGLHLTRQVWRSQAAERQMRASEANFRLQAENLRQANERITLATDGGAIGIWDWDVTNDAMVWDSWMYRLFGLESTDEPASYALWQRHVHPDDRAAAKAAVRQALRAGTSYETDFRVVWADGSVHHLRGSGQVTRDAASGLIRMTGANWDVTRQHEAEQRELAAAAKTNAHLNRLSRHLAKARDRAEQASQAKSRFLAGMSHELRTPLNGILGYAQLLHMEGELNPLQHSRVDAMLQAGKHLLQMITRVLDLSEIEAEHVTLQAAPLDARALAEACLDCIRPAAEAKGLALSVVATPDPLPEVVADAMRLRQILLNLLGNAAKFTAQGSITLRLRPNADGSVLRIEVADTGAGVPAEQRARLFQDFGRLDTEATRMAEGAGLGLALSARLASLMGGRLEHEDNPGGGSVFWLELPVRDPALPAPAAEGQDALATLASTRPLRVLVVDDVAMNRDIAGSFLRAAGHEAFHADSGAAAIAAVAATAFDVVLMDVRMPGMDGLQATRRIRALDDGRGQVPIIALTAQAFTDQVEACRAAGMDSHLSKPFEMDALLAAVTTAARHQPAPNVSYNNSPPGPDAAAPAAHPDPPDLDPLPADPLPGNPLPAGPASPVINPQAFAHTVAFLLPETVASYLRTLLELGTTLLRALREPDALRGNTEDLASATHTLAGSAGMFGFQRLASAGQRFERALQTGSPEAAELAKHLDNAIEDTCHDIRERMT